MKCDCGEEATFLKIRWQDGHLVRQCDKCAGVANPHNPDVYFERPYFDGNLGDEKHPHGQWVSSPKDKARIMKEQGLIERGDRVHGARVPYEKGYGGREVDLNARS